MQVILMAQGEQTRWRMEENLPSPSKHLLAVGQETLLGRTVRLLREYGQANILIVGKHEYQACGAHTFQLDDPGPLLSGILQIGNLFKNGRTLILLGDVLFSRAAIQTVLTPLEDTKFYGRLYPSTVSPKVAQELFGLQYQQDDWPRLRDHCASMLRRDFVPRYPPKLWALYRLCSGFEHDEYKVNPGTIINIQDYTDDCDSYDEYRVFWKPMTDAALADTK